MHFYLSRGPIPWRFMPTDRQKIISERLAEKVKEETGQVVDPETIRAFRYTVNKWPGLSAFESRDELEALTARAKIERHKDRLLRELRVVENKLALFGEHDGLDDMPLLNLRDRAKQLSIQGYQNMRKREVISAIRTAEDFDFDDFGDDDE